MLVQVLLWSLAIFALIGGGVWLRVRTAARQRQRRLQSELDRDPLPAWDRDALGVSAVRVQGVDPERPPALRGGGGARAEAAVATPEASGADEDPSPAEPPRMEAASASTEPAGTDPADAAERGAAPRGGAETAPEAPPQAPPAPPEASGETDASTDAGTADSPAAEWWGAGAETGALLRSLVEATGGSAALLRPDPSDGGFIVLAAAGPAAAALHAREGTHRLGRVRALDDLPRDLSATVFSGAEAGILPGAAPEASGETAVRALAAPPAPRRLLVADVPAEAPLDTRAERLFGLYADLLARVHDLPLTPPAPAPPAPDPVAVVMDRLADEMMAAREHGRPLALALVAVDGGDALVEADPEAVAEAEGGLRQRLEAAAGTREVLPMGTLAFAVLCEADSVGAGRWVEHVAGGALPLRVGVAVYGPRHVEAALLRQEAAQALHQAFTSDSEIVIVE